MKIIAFEGLDKSGKHTQMNALADRLWSEGMRVETLSFHNYDSPVGQLIQKWLYREFEMPLLAINYIISADKLAYLDKFKEWEQDGVDYLLIDRYLLSQMVYPIAMGLDVHVVEDLAKYIPEPDYTIMIDISVDTSIDRKGKHGDNDRIEENYSLNEKVRAEYLSRLSSNPNNFIINDADSLSVEYLKTVIFEWFCKKEIGVAYGA